MTARDQRRSHLKFSAIQRLRKLSWKVLSAASNLQGLQRLSEYQIRGACEEARNLHEFSRLSYRP